MGLFDFAKKVMNDVSKISGKTEKPTAKGKKVTKVSKPAQKKTTSKAKKVSPKTAKTIKEKEVGVITHYFGKISVGIIKLKDGLKVGDKIHIKGAHDDFTQVIKSMQLNHQDITQGPKGKEIGIKVKARVHENDKVYKVVG